jgi:predicted XRE-type DNA-binding protein
MTTYSSDIETQLNNLIQKLPSPTTLLNSLTSIQEQYPSVLDDFKKYYVLYYRYSNVDEYSQMFFSRVKGNINKLNSDLFTDTATIENSIQQLGQVMAQVNKNINQEKIQQETLKNKLFILKSENNGSMEMTRNYRTMYNLQFFSNITMFLGVILVIYMTHKVFKKRNG